MDNNLNDLIEMSLGEDDTYYPTEATMTRTNRYSPDSLKNLLLYSMAQGLFKPTGRPNFAAPLLALMAGKQLAQSQGAGDVDWWAMVQREKYKGLVREEEQKQRMVTELNVIFNDSDLSNEERINKVRQVGARYNNSTLANWGMEKPKEPKELSYIDRRRQAEAEASKKIVRGEDPIKVTDELIRDFPDINLNTVINLKSIGKPNVFKNRQKEAKDRAIRYLKSRNMDVTTQNINNIMEQILNQME